MEVESNSKPFRRIMLGLGVNKDTDFGCNSTITWNYLFLSDVAPVDCRTLSSLETRKWISRWVDEIMDVQTDLYVLCSSIFCDLIVLSA